MSEKSLGRQVFDHAFPVLPDFHLLFLFPVKVVQKLRQLVQIVSSVDHVHPGIFDLELVYYVLLLHHTAAYAYRERFLFLGLSALQLSKSAEEPLVGVFPYAACIEYHYIGAASVLCLLISLFQEQAGHYFRIVLVHLTAESRDMKSLFFRQNCLHSNA